MPNLNIYADSMTINRELSSYTNVPEKMQNSKDPLERWPIKRIFTWFQLLVIVAEKLTVK